MMKLIVLAVIALLVWQWVRKDERRHVSRQVSDAAALLDIPADADRDVIVAAHRRMIARVHPDLGGDPLLATKINAARDIMLDVRPPA